MMQHKKQRGAGLVELMIGMGIGLFLLAGLTNYFGQSKRVYAYQQSQAGQQNSERLVDVIISTALRQAGFAQLTNQRIISRTAIFPAVGAFAAGNALVGTESTANVTVNGMTGAQPFPNDTLTVRYTDGAGIVDCVGNPIPLGTLSTDVIATDGVNLTCSTNGGAPIPLLGDSLALPDQQLRILGLALGYGLDTDGDGSVDTYQRAGAILNWNQVRIVEVEMSIQSGRRPPETMSFSVTLENMQGAV